MRAVNAANNENRCKASKSECPVSVDMASYKAEFLAHNYKRQSRPIRALLFGHIDWWAALVSTPRRCVPNIRGYLDRRSDRAAGTELLFRVPR